MKYIFFIILFSYCVYASTNFPKIQNLLNDALTYFPQKKEDFAKNVIEEKSKIMKELLGNDFMTINYNHRTVEYLGITKDNIQNFIDNLCVFINDRGLTGILNNKSFAIDIKQIFISKKNEVVLDKLIIKDALSKMKFIYIMGELVDKNTSNWIIFENTVNFIVDAEYEYLRKSDSFFWGLYTSESVEVVGKVPSISDNQFTSLYKFFELLMLQRSLDYFKIINPYIK